MQITSDFDGGNIRVIDASDKSDIRLEIEKDTNADFHQWFCFDVEDAVGETLTLRIMNAGSSSYPKGWKGYDPCYRAKDDVWRRTPGKYEEGVLAFSLTPQTARVRVAYFAPYQAKRAHDFCSAMKARDDFSYEELGRSADGQPMHYFGCGEGDAKMWVIARQHPGETMGSWWMEGFMEALIDPSNVHARALRAAARIHLAPLMNPDGAQRGHLRTNAPGQDLNRAWRNASMEKSPEVFLVREKMRATGCDFFLDVHGDENIANNFIADAKGIPSWTDELERQVRDYESRLLAVSKDFQTEEGYPTPAPGGANLDIATNFVAEEFGCLAITLEMPFKDAKVNLRPDTGWAPERCKQSAREHLEVMAEMAGALRG